MDDLRQWLDSIGLGQYADPFETNEIDKALLPELTEAHLKELGVAAMGHRLRLLRAIEALPGTHTTHEPLSPQPTDTQASTGTSRTVRDARGGAAEHRQLTVMFCDLVGSVELGERMDVEDYRELLAQFREAVVSAIARFDGFVARHQGDGVLAYFGYPHAHEDDAERAVRAGLAIIDAVTALERTCVERTAVRVGIATGPAVVGDLLETGESAELAALGQTPNLAARLQGAAASNALLISERTARLVGERFETHATPPLELKGIRGPRRAYRVLALHEAAAELDHESEYLTPMIGRTAELALLHDRWSKACEGAGQAVHVSADPGIGKSRLVDEFRRLLDEHTSSTVTLQCSPYHASSPLYPVIEALRRRFATGPEPLDLVVERLRELDLDLDRHVPVLASLLDLPPSPPYKPVDLPGPELRKAILDTLELLVERMTTERPVLVLAEDLHWVDPTTATLLGRLVDLARSRPLMLLTLSRPEWAPPWHAEPHLSELRLNHLTPGECRSLVESLAEHDRTLEQHVDRVVARADGVPLFLEELWRTLSEADAGDTIPETLRDALTARLDRLGDAKEVARAASALGREFSSALLPGMTGLTAAQIDQAMDRLVDSRLMQRMRSSVSGDHRFKHALVRDAAYDSMLRGQRRELHGRAAVALLASGADAPPELVATHFEHAQVFERAMDLWSKAGERASERGAYDEAEAHHRRALALAEAHGPDPDRCVDYSASVAYSMHLNGRRTDAAELLARHGNMADVAQPGLVARFYRIGAEIRSFLGQRAETRECLARALEAAERASDPRLRAKVVAALGFEELFLEDLPRALDHFEAAARGYGDDTALDWSEREGLALTLYGLAMVATRMGRLRTARKALAELERLTGEWGTAALSIMAMEAASGVCVFAGEFDRAIETAKRALAADPPPFNEALILAYLFAAYAVGGDSELALGLLDECVQKAGRYRSKQVQLMVALTLGHTYCDIGAWDEASGSTDDCARRALETGVPDTAVKFLRGRVALGRGDTAAARECFDGALRGFRASGERPLEARTQLRLAALEHADGQVDAAKASLQAAYDMCVEMELDWVAARAEALASELGLPLELVSEQ